MKQAFICLSVLVLSFALSFESSAQYKCVNDKSGKKGNQNQDINKSLTAASDPLTVAFNTKRSGLDIKDCPPSMKASSPQLSGDFIDAISRISSVRTKQIKKECIEASLQREVGNEGYSCNGDTKKKFENAGASAPCLSQKTVDFIHYAVNQAINCMSTGRNPIDPRFILKKFNNETAFNFYIAYSGGKGLGQLTSNPVDEIAGWYKGKKFIEGNAFYILEGLMASNNPSCRPFKEIIQKDINSPPPSPGSARNYCAWIRPGDGIARNLVYSLGYYIHMRDNIIKPALEKRAQKLARNDEVINYLTLVAYGPGGPEEAKTLIRRFRFSDSTTPAQAKSKIIANNAYVNQTEDKFADELLKVMKDKPTEADKRGDTCVQ
ncbi:hypothetical protein QJS83_10530 [Bdellovibrio sp. 22V]|uniref:hypothetical protein n=1 Tax=Bdellovibrio TaxID=958 RepID=UPI002542F148|nr:hypothetical protein [Bdellovibrio sp. 22V]WII70896.1 hypothetical protein QJS83_10530 [Bdellovibrio sp. 22V]